MPWRLFFCSVPAVWQRVRIQHLKVPTAQMRRAAVITLIKKKAMIMMSKRKRAWILRRMTQCRPLQPGARTQEGTPKRTRAVSRLTWRPKTARLSTAEISPCRRWSMTALHRAFMTRSTSTAALLKARIPATMIPIGITGKGPDRPQGAPAGISVSQPASRQRSSMPLWRI